METVIEMPKGILSGIADSVLPDKNKENIDIDIENIENKPIIICILFLEEPYQNIEPNKLKFDYLIVDLRNEMCRNYYKIYLYKNTDYYYILYRHSFETNNGLYYNNEITDFPLKQSTKNTYDKILLLENIYEPKCYISLCRFCCLR